LNKNPLLEVINVAGQSDLAMISLQKEDSLLVLVNAREAKKVYAGWHQLDRVTVCAKALLLNFKELCINRCCIHKSA
jgi:hypothetical protein